MEHLFDGATPTNLCRTRAWCRINVGNFVIWWPESFRIDQLSFLQLVEIDPPIPDSTTTSITTARDDQGQTAQSESSADDWTTSDLCESDATSMFQRPRQKIRTESLRQNLLPTPFCVYMYMNDRNLTWCDSYAIYRDPMTGLPPPGNTGFDVHKERLQHDMTAASEDCATSPAQFPLNLSRLLSIPTPVRNLASTLPTGILTAGLANCSGEVQAAQAVARQPALPISIDMALQENIPSRSFELPDFASLFSQLLEKRQPIPPRWKTIHDEMPEPLRPQFLNMNLERPECVHELHIYSDGSYKKRRDGVELATWAFVVLVPGTDGMHLLDFGYGQTSSSSDEKGWTGATDLNSRTAELDALIHVCEWIICGNWAVPHFVYFDACAAGLIADGSWQIRQGDFQALLLRNLALTANYFIEKTQPVQWQHCKGHSGVFGNELADSFAKMALKNMTTCGAFCHIDYSPYIIGPAPMISWLWLWVSGQQITHDLPYDDVGNFKPRMPQETQLLDKKIVVHKTTTVQNHTEPKRSQLMLCTHNVGSLQTQKTGFGANIPQYIREQFEAHGVHILFLQETRARTSGVVESSTHIRLISASQAGHGGTEIWLLKACTATSRLLCDVRKVVVLYQDAEALCVKLLYDGIHMLLISAHAPHTGRKDDDVQQFWDNLTQLTDRFLTSNQLMLLGIDANAHFDHECPPCVGSHGLEERTSIGASFFLRYLQRFGLYLPSTFGHQHEGPTWTWTHPGNGSRARCDYIAAPQMWKDNAVRAWSPDSIDIGKASFDHAPLFLVTTLIEERTCHRPARHSFDRMAITKASVEQLTEVMEALPQVPWDCGVDEHAVIASEAIHHQLVQAFPNTLRKPKKSYISEDTWTLRFDSLRHRRIIRSGRQCLDGMTVRCAFQVWREGTLWTPAWFLGSLFAQLGKIYKAHQQLKSLSKFLRKALRKDRTDYIADIAIKASSMPASEFYSAMKQIGVTGRNKNRGIRPLPVLKSLEGEVLETWEAVAARWQEHFAHQEDGMQTTLEQLVQTSSTTARPDNHLHWKYVPTLLEPEEQFRRTASLKAFFDDMVPGEFPHRAPALAARYFYPLFLKMVYSNREPLLYKGALLVPAYKQKGPIDQCDSFRSLAVSSTVGKAFHALYRKRVLQQIEDHILPFQVGGRPGKSITQASQALIAAHKTAQKRGWSTAVLFIDVQQAFYRLLRHHVTEVHDRRSYADLFRSLNLPEQAYEDFCALLEQGDGMNAFRLPAPYRQIFGEFYRATWFVVPGSQVLTSTMRGSRPGDSLADLAFMIAMAHTLRSCYQKIDELQQCRWQWSGTHEPQATRQCDCEVGLVCPIWADDFALLLCHPNAIDLLPLTMKITGHILDAFVVAGMKPNMSWGKTELLVDVRGKGTQKVKREIREQALMIPTESKYEPQLLHVVGRYKHLGTWLSTKATMLYDIRTKLAIAHSTMTKYRAAIFHNRGLLIERKVQMFRQLILSAIVFSSAAWHVLSKKEYMTFTNGIYALYKRLAMMHHGVKAKHWTNLQISAELQLETPDTILRVGRLRYLQHLVRQGQPQLWGILQQDDQWWRQLQEDFCWLRAHIPTVSGASDLFADWELLSFELQRPGGTWKGAIKRALIAHLRYTQILHQWNSWHDAVGSDFLRSINCHFLLAM